MSSRVGKNKLVNKTFLSALFINSVVSAEPAIIFIFFSLVIATRGGDSLLILSNLVNPYSAAAVVFGCVVGMGSCQEFLKAVNASKEQESKEIFSTSFIFSSILSVLYTLFLTIFKNRIIAGFDISDYLLTDADKLFNFVILTSFLVPIYSYIGIYIVGEADYLINALSIVIPIPLALLIVYLFLPKYGIATYGIATSVQYGSGLLIQAIHFFKKTSNIKFSLSFKPKYIPRFIRYGLVDGEVFILQSLATIIIEALIIKYVDETYIIAFGVINSLSLLLAYLDGVGGAIMPLSFMYLEEKNKVGFNRFVSKKIMVVFIEAFILFITYTLFPRQIVNFLGITNSNQIEVSIKAIRILAFATIFEGLGYFTSSYLLIRSLPYKAAFISLVKTFVAPVLIVLIFIKSLGFNAVVLAYTLCALISVIVAVLIILISTDKEINPFRHLRNKNCDNFSIKVNDESIKEFIIKTREFLDKLKVSDSVKNKANLIIEEIVNDINENNKNSILQVDIFIYEKELNLVFKYNGKQINYESDVLNPKTFRRYFIDRILTRSKNRYNFVTGMNRFISKIPLEN